MGVHWETSLKPLYVKTVWIDGRRHAILSKDDPVAQAISPIVSSAPTRTSMNSSPRYSPTSTPTDSPTFVLNANPLNLRNWEKQKGNASGCQDVYKIERNCHTAGKIDEAHADRNPLSERVLQWLDLAGRENIKLGIDEIKTASKNNETDIDTITNKIVEQYTTDRKLNHRISRKQVKSQKPYKTHDDGRYSEDSRSYLYPASYVSDNIQNYVKKTINEPIPEASYPTRTALSANIISFQEEASNNSSESSDNKSYKNNKKNIKRFSTTSTLSMALRHKPNNDEQIENPIKAEKQLIPLKGSLESQYIDMIRKKMSEANYNIKASRRQLHIFIPSLPKNICDSKTSSILTVDET